MRLVTNIIEMLGRFRGMPNYPWLEETLVRLEETFGLSTRPKGLVSFDNNPSLRGIQHFEQLLNSIAEQNVLYINYRKFGQEITERVIHPYQLRQYSNRWFLIGMEPNRTDNLPFVILPLDRIISFRVADDIIFQIYQGTDIEEYFSQVVGVSVNAMARKEIIVIKAGYPAAEYLISKPLHHSQKILEQNEKFTLIEYTLIPNYEFETQLLGFLNECEIIRPQSLKEKMKKRAMAILVHNT